MTEVEISGYRICETVGSGKAGMVFQAVRSGEDRIRALKRFNAISIDRDFLERNHQKLAGTPPHPGIVEVSGFQFDQAPYIVEMAWIEPSSTLEQLPGPLPEETAWPVIYELAESLSHLHTHGVRHGNLHPGNVFFDMGADPRTRMTDFGSGLTGRIHHIDIAETAWFAPPEQLERPDEYGEGAMERWDVYRFGALAFWTINGEVPRGHRYLESYKRSLAGRSGRQIVCDLDQLARDLRDHPDYEWERPAESRADQLRREIIDRCLAISPSDRPTDMREVWTEIEKLEARFELEESQVKVCEERSRQLGRLHFTRAVAACLAGGLALVSALWLSKLKRNRSLHEEVGNLNSVVERQQHRIADYDRRWTESLADLKEFRSAAGSIFSQMSKADSSAGEKGGIEHEVLEKSRSYFERTLEALGESPSEQFERAGCLHNLAHVEAQLGNTDAARDRYREAANLFEAIAESRPDETELIVGIDRHLLDCYERLAGLVDLDPSDELLSALERASDLFARNRETLPDDQSLAIRQAMIQLNLGRQLQAHRRLDEAIEVFASAGKNMAEIGEENPDEPLLSDLLSRIQFCAARSLREAGRESEAIDSHLAAMETLTGSMRGQPHSREQCRRLGLSYAELGELFAGHAEGNDTRTHFNEALRLLAPICEAGAGDPETAISLSRSMAHIAKLERDASHWTDAYRMSLAAIENLEAALESHPDDVDCQLALSGLRVSHTEALRYNRKAALRCLENGLNMIVSVQDQIEGDDSVIEPVRRAWGNRVADTYEQYRALCESFGETEKAQMCSDRAARVRELLAQSNT